MFKNRSFNVKMVKDEISTADPVDDYITKLEATEEVATRFAMSSFKMVVGVILVKAASEMLVNITSSN